MIDAMAAFNLAVAWFVGGAALNVPESERGHAVVLLGISALNLFMGLT